MPLCVVQPLGLQSCQVRFKGTVEFSSTGVVGVLPSLFCCSSDRFLNLVPLICLIAGLGQSVHGIKRIRLSIQHGAAMLAKYLRDRFNTEGDTFRTACLKEHLLGSVIFKG